ncbi:MAG TPA: hypothetical protein DSN98_00305 [Thermoplasmata archaeon]|jgi:hypothetical protein|nr:MAG TPA: hypothetical protein DSN98_00305 [Thermoplasmata archaeon]
MKKYPLIGVSIVAVVVLILASLSNVVGFQTVQTSHRQAKKETVNQRELLFQTILDITNNREIQRIILKSQMSRGISPTSEIPVLTKNQLKRMYLIGLVLSKFSSKSRIQSMIRAHQLINPELQQEINAVIEKNVKLQEDIMQLSNSGCDCESKDASSWHFPIICTLMIPLYAVGAYMLLSGWRWDLYLCETIGALIIESIEKIASHLGCKWYLNQNNQFPYISDISPADGEQNVSLSLTELSFKIHDIEGDLMSYKVTTSPDIGGGTATLIPNGTYTIPIVHPLQNGTTYSWLILIYEGDTSGTPVGRTRTFTTETLFPLIRNPSPNQNAEFVPISTSNVSFDLTDYQGDLMNWTVETQPDIGSGAGTGVGNGRYTVPISGLDYFTSYTWFVNVTDGRYWSKKMFSFRTSSENTVVLEPTDDATISEVSPNSNAGTSDPIDIRSHISISWLELDGLIKYNISTLPSNVTIQYASLQLYYFHSSDGNPGGHQVNAYKVTSDWDEGTVTWNTQPSYDPEPSSLAIVPSTLNTWVFWNLTGDIQLFYLGGAPNYGWRMVDTSGSQECSCYHSKEYSEYHPLLIIGYK